MTLGPGSIVILHLVSPSEKHWGALLDLDQAGVVVRGINISSFDDWIGELGKGEEPAIGLSTMFVPLFRVERIFLDEALGGLESYAQQFERRSGFAVEQYLGLADLGGVPS